MIARRITGLIVCACLAVPALMYLRDVGDSPASPTAAEASFDARRVLTTIAPDCDSRCRVDILGTSAAHTWRTRLSTGAWQHCYDVDPTAFSFSPDHGFHGVKSAPCRI